MIIPPPNKPIRQSGIELLRLVAMMLVLGTHANFLALGDLTYDGLMASPTSESFRMFLEMLCLCCVNVFVMISGWFGIHPSVNGLLNFLFQCLFFLVGTFIVCKAMGLVQDSIPLSIAKCLLLMPQNWFIKAYLLLYILSPVLNTFCEKSDYCTLKTVVVAFMCFQFIYGWMFPGMETFDRGYSTISFIGLYLLMQLVRRSQSRCFKLSMSKDLLLYVLFCLLQTILYIAVVTWRKEPLYQLSGYNGPFIIPSALFLYLAFNKMTFVSPFVNKVAKSAFAVYLLHASPFVLTTIFAPHVRNLYVAYSGMTCVTLILAYIVGVLILAILIDQVRLIIWNRLIQYNDKY